MFDISLLYELKKGNREAFNGVFRYYYPRIMAYTASMVEQKAAEDIVQDVFLKLLSKNIAINSSSEKSYLFKMTANLCKDYLKSKRAKNTDDYDEVMEGMSTSDSFTDDERQLYDELMQLPDIQRVPVYLHFYEGYTYKEIAKILQISESAVAMRISRGKDELKKRLEE